MGAALFLQACELEPLPKQTSPAPAPIASPVTTDVPAPAPEPVPVPVPAARPAFAPVGPAAPDVEPVTIDLSWCDRAGCELVLTFSRPMVGADELKSKPAVDVKLDPPQKGRWSWRTQTELVFTPAENQLLWGHEVLVTVNEAVPLDGPAFKLASGFQDTFRVPYFSAVGKVASWPIVLGRPRFVAFLNSSIDRVGQGPMLLLYDQPVDPTKIARKLRVVDAEGRRLAATALRPARIDLVTDEKVDLAHVVAVTLTSLPPDGEVVTLSYPTWSDDDANKTEGSRSFTVSQTFAVVRFGQENGYGEYDEDGDGRAPDANRAPLRSSWRIDFTNPVSSTRLEEHVTITPKPRSMSVSVWGAQGWINAHLEPGTLYTLTIDTKLRDFFGNPLRAPLIASFRARDREPSIETPALALTLERGRARLPIQAVNVRGLSIEEHEFASVADFARALAGETQDRCGGYGLTGRPRVTKPQLDKADTTLNVVVRPEIELGRDATRAAALRCVQVSAQGRGSEGVTWSADKTALVQVTGLGVTGKVFEGETLIWVTRLADATPVRGARVTLLDEHGQELAGGPTPEDGVVRLRSQAAPRFAAVETDDDAAVLELLDDRLSHAWQFGLEGAARGAETLAGALFTDRGVYRPGETVHVKAIARDGAFAIPAKANLDVVILDPRGGTALQKSIALDRFGAAEVTLPLGDGAAVGRWSLRASMGDAVVARHFEVQEYRVPTFQVDVASDEAEWTAGKTAHALIAAKYLHGDRMGGRGVTWEIRREPEPFAPGELAGYRFSAAEASRGAEALSSGGSRLDGQGRLALSFQPEAAPGGGPVRYVVEATVTDVDRQAWVGRMSRVVHPTAFYLGVRPPSRELLPAGEAIEVPIVALDPDGKARAGVDVIAKLERIDHHGVVRLSGDHGERIDRAVPAVAATCTITTKKAPVTCSLRPPSPGEYRVRAIARDPSHRAVESGFDFTVAGDGEAAWPRFDRDRVDVIADRKSYEPGDTARLTVQSPFKPAAALLTIEREGVIDHRLLAIRGNAPLIEIPLDGEHVPNVFASIVLLRGRVHDQKDATGFETGAPAFKIGYTRLRVAPADRRLSVTVTPAQPVAKPGGKLAIDVEVRDRDGKPRAGQATVMVVDEAVLGLTRHAVPDPLAEIFTSRPLAVRTAESRLELPSARRARRDPVFPGGDGGGWYGDEEGEPSLPDPPYDVRKSFKSTAYWNADVTVGADGRARVEATLPDNVTTFRVVAVVIDAETRAGSGMSKVVVRKPLLVQPVLPRFVHPGDTLRVEALAHNGTGVPGHVVVSAGFDGLALDGKGTAPTLERDVAAGQAHTFSFPVVVTGRKEVVVRFTARMGEERDAVEVRVPVLNPGSRRALVVQRQISGSGEIELDLPAGRAVDYLMEYPNGCIEQTTSTAYPLLVLGDLLPDMGVTVDQTKLADYSKAGVKRLLSFQTTSGGLAYWPGSDSPHAFGTAFGSTVLIEAKKRGYDVPDDALARIAGYLERVLNSGAISGEMPHGGMADADTRAFIVMTLHRLGRRQDAYVESLWRAKDKLTPFGLSFLAVAVQEGPGDKSLLPSILAEIRKAAKESREEAWYEGDPKGGWSMDSPLRTHAGALLAYARAAGSSDEMRGKLLAGLLGRQEHGLWGNTQENVFGIMGVASLVGSARSAPPDVTFSVNGRAVEAKRIESAGKGGRRVRLSDDDLRAAGVGDALKVKVGGGSVWVTVRVEYDVKLDEQTMKPRSEGFEVTRRYESLDGKSLDGKTIPLGSLVRVRVKVKSKELLHYVAIADLLPAGLEALNGSLATTEKASLGKVTPEIERGLAALSYGEIRDSRVSFYADELPPGTVEYVYVARATTPGRFLRPAANAEAMYAPQVAGSTAIDLVVVR
jgi:hypothetical protein